MDPRKYLSTITSTTAWNVSTDNDTDTSDEDEDEDSDLAHVALNEDLKRQSVTYTLNERYFGQSSVFMFAKHVSALNTPESSTWPDTITYRRQIYWDIGPWERSFVTNVESTAYVFPDEDLLVELAIIYEVFGFCALGSKYSYDPRVLDPNDLTGLSSGWHFFSQVPLHRRNMLYNATIHDLQYYPLASLYLLGSSMPNAAWNLLGIGLRYALEKGAHRRRRHKQPLSAEDELQKRAFWSLVCMDRLICSFLGRPCVLLNETIDVGHPLKCDDEYWETSNPEHAFKQPDGKPCSITSFILLIHLCEILGFALRSLYTNKKLKVLSGFLGNEWEGRMVAELDSAMNKFMGSLPDHLKWDSEQQDPLFFHQSVDLHATYYYVQILIHRPFLTKQSSLTFASRAMCSSATRSCSRVLEAATARGLCVLPSTMTVAFTIGLIIVLTLRGGSSIGYMGDAEKDRENLRKCANFLKECETRWHSAGRMWDILNGAGAAEEYNQITIGDIAPNERRHETLNNQDYTSQDSGSMVLMSEGLGHSLSFNRSSTSTPLDVDQAVPDEFDWDLHRLLLTEMGYLPDNPQENTEAIFATTAESTFPHHNTASTSSATAQQAYFSSQHSMYGVWPPPNNPVNSVRQEWELFMGGNLGMA